MAASLGKSNVTTDNRYLAFPTTLKLAEYSSLLPPQSLSPRAKFCHDLFYAGLLYFLEISMVLFKILSIIQNGKNADTASVLRTISVMAAEINSIFKAFVVFRNRKKINYMIDFCADRNWMMPRNEAEAAEMKSARKFSG